MPVTWGGFHLASWSRFDHLGDPTEVWTAETGLTHVARDEAGWTTEWSLDDTFTGDPSFECTHSDQKRLHHDARGRLLEVFQGASNETSAQLTRTGGYSYDAMGRVLTFTDGEGNTYRYAYDGAGRLQNVDFHAFGTIDILPGGGSAPAYDTWMSYTYADAGPKPTTMLDAANEQTTWSYDDLGRPLTQTVTGRAGPETTTWLYDTYPGGSPAWLGAVTAVSFPTEHGLGALTYRYDPVGGVGGVGGFGWVTEEEQFLPGAVPADDRTYTFTHEHDGQGWVTKTTWPDQPTGTLEVFTDYHDNGLASQQRVKLPSGSLPYDLLYDQWAQLQDWSLDPLVGTASGAIARSSAGRVDGISWDIGGTTREVDYGYCGEDEKLAYRKYTVGSVHELRYTYDRLGRIGQVDSLGTLASGVAEAYQCDHANRMTWMEVPGAGLDERTFTYSAATADLQAIDLVNQPAPYVAPHTLTHDAAFRIIADDRPNALLAYSYDGSSRLVQATRTPNGGAAQFVDYWYAPGDRIAQEVKSSGDEIHRFNGYQERDGTAYAEVLPWLTLKDGVPRYTLDEPDGRASVVMKPNGTQESEKFVSAYGLTLTSLPGYSYTVGSWPLDELHGSEPDSVMSVTHFGARHMAMRGDGMWMQREPLLANALLEPALRKPLALGTVYGAGNTNLYADPSGNFVQFAAAEVVIAGAAVVAMTGAAYAAHSAYQNRGAIQSSVSNAANNARYAAAGAASSIQGTARLVAVMATGIMSAANSAEGSSTEGAETGIQDIDAASPPFTGEPGTTVRGKKQTRRYAEDGYPLTDRDLPHAGERGPGDTDVQGSKDHAHDWSRPEGGGPPSRGDRGPSRPPREGDPPIPRGFGK